MTGLSGRASSFAWKWKMPVAAAVVGEELGKIEEEFGAVTPVSIVDAARSNDSPLHTLFTWDDSVAGPKYRLTEARYILRNLVILTAKNDADADDPRRYTVRAFLSVPDEQSAEDDEDSDGELPQMRTVYVSAQNALIDERKRAYVLQQARLDLEAWRNRYQGLTEFADLMTAIDEALRTFTNEVTVK